MISEMLKVREGRIRRILARTSTLSVTRNVARGEAGLSNCGANGRAFQEQRKEGRQEVRSEEWSEGDERHGRLSREVAVEHRGSDRDTRRNQRSARFQAPCFARPTASPALRSPSTKCSVSSASFHLPNSSRAIAPKFGIRACRSSNAARARCCSPSCP